MHILQHIVLPSLEWRRWTNIFVRTDAVHWVVTNGKYQKVRLYEFNTWMNLFAASKWYRYCDLGELYLSLSVKGKYHLQVIGSNHNYAFGVQDTILVDEDIAEEEVGICVPDAAAYESIYFIIFEDAENPVEIVSAAWATDKAPMRKNRLAIVSCTFRREKYITKTISVFEDWIKHNPELKDRVKLFVVDNGKTLDAAAISNDTTTIIPNINAGGAGGFTRGLMEVCYLNKGAEKEMPFTRVLFMDDDVEVLPEAFYRTLVLTDYLKEEWKESFINGAMMNIRHKNMFFENIALQNRLWVIGYFQNIDINIYADILKINRIPDTIFSNAGVKTDSAWWFHCFDIETAKNGLPVPCFIRGDDVEWSWRNFGKHHISINGICVWHEPFEWRVTPVADYYYTHRNMFFNNVLYTQEFKTVFEKYFTDLFNYLLQTYNYNSIEIFLCAMDDILKGSAVFEEDPEVQFKKLSDIPKKIVYYDAAPEELEEAKNFFPSPGLKRKILDKLTWGGLLCPDFLLKTSIALEWWPPIDNFYLRKEVKVYNLVTKKYCIRRFDRKAHLRYTKEFHKRLGTIKARYDELRTDFTEAHKKLTSLAFWEKYLGIKGEQS